MKKKTLKFTVYLLSVLLASVLVLSACGKSDGETTAPAVPDETTTAEPTLDEMSPPSYKKDIPVDYCVDYGDIDTSSFTEIASDDAMISGLSTEHIYRDANGREYYIVTDGSVVLSFVENGEAYSAYYRDSGTLKYFGDSETGWFFTEDGTLDMVSYTFVNAKGSEIVSYYEPDGTRFVISAADTYYDDNLDELTLDKQLEFTKRLGGTTDETETAETVS